jgi:hypothetical protein
MRKRRRGMNDVSAARSRRIAALDRCRKRTAVALD